MFTRLRGRSRSIFAVLACVMPALALGALCLAQDSAQSGKAETAGQKYKNIKVLKDLPADKLIPMMHQFNADLGVRCDACHVVKADHTGFELDDKKMKLKAREMITMAQNLNKHSKTVEGKVTCYMCHRGQTEPVSQPPDGGAAR